MAKNKTIHLRSVILEADRRVLATVKGLAGYAPANNAYTVEALEALSAGLAAAQMRRVQAKAAWQAARDEEVAAEWAFHQAVLAVKTQVVAQFGADTNEAQAVGLKKPSEYKPRRRKKAS